MLSNDCINVLTLDVLYISAELYPFLEMWSSCDKVYVISHSISGEPDFYSR